MQPQIKLASQKMMLLEIFPEVYYTWIKSSKMHLVYYINTVNKHKKEVTTMNITI